jgi:tRNA modification GTPase
MVCAIVLAGPPNSGKSTLLNALVAREAAIVSDIAGTTRDLIEVPVAFEGIPFLFTDTAGLRDDSGDVIEAIGIERAARGDSGCGHCAVAWR